MDINYLLIFIFAFTTIASPGPATLAITGVSMKHGRLSGISIALGVLTGSLIWSISAAFGLALILKSNEWLLGSMKLLAAFYLLYLSLKSFKSALTENDSPNQYERNTTVHGFYFRGLLIHLTNPKAILFFASLYSVVIPTNGGLIELTSVMLTVAFVSLSVFVGYAILFSTYRARALYLKSKRYFEFTFAAVFGVASIKLLIEGGGT